MEKSCILVVHVDKGTPALSTAEIKESLEGNDVTSKIEALKKATISLLNGVFIPELCYSVIRYVSTCDDRTVQKFFLLYLEIINKTEFRGEVLPELIFICQALRDNLQSTNVSIRGVTLRFLCRINEPKIVEPMIPSILSNLKHSHPFVRRNAVLAVMSVYKLPRGEHLLDNMPEIVEKFLESEHDLSCKRNALLMLISCAQDRAVSYLFSNIDSIIDWGEQLQMVVLELIKKVCTNNENEKEKFIMIIRSLLSATSTSNAVFYECASTLVSLTSAPTEIEAAAIAYCRLLLSQSDNNVKLIVLDRLNELKSSHREIMVVILLDLLMALSIPNNDIRRKAIDIALDLTTSKNIHLVVNVLNTQVFLTQSLVQERNEEYRQMLMQAICTCAIKFPEVANTFVRQLMDFFGDSDVAHAMDVVVFIQEIIETNPELRVSIITRLLKNFSRIRASRVCCCALRIISKYCLSLSEVERGIAAIKHCLGDPPFYTIYENGGGQETSKAVEPVNSATVSSMRPAIVADGTYATKRSALKTAMSLPTPVKGSLSSMGNLRSLILSGDFFLGAVVACTLTKLILRLEEVQTSKVEVNKATSQSLLIIVSILQLGQSSVLPHPIDKHSYDRIILCISLLCTTADELRKTWLQSWRQNYVNMFADKQCCRTDQVKEKSQILNAQTRGLLDFFHLKSRKVMCQLEMVDKVQDNLKRATGELTEDAFDANKHNHILQLTGFSDPIYAEAYVTIHHYDIVLDVTVINQTKETLKNLCLELATIGDLKLVERPQNYNLAPESSKQIKANIKVSSTETGVIFGNIVYETSSSVLEREVIVLNVIHVNIMDYIAPASCAHVAYRTMWAEFEWENKVSINTVLKNERGDLLGHCNCEKCSTPLSLLEGECGFLTANLNAKSVFGEDTLANVSIEKQAAGRLSRYIRTRSKTQGIPLRLGDKRLKQKGTA